MSVCTRQGPAVYETTTLRPARQKSHELEAESNLFRCMSDASLVKRRRGTVKSAAQREKERQHRFSINGHFYNYKVAFYGRPFRSTLNEFINMVASQQRGGRRAVLASSSLESESLQRLTEHLSLNLMNFLSISTLTREEVAH